jgi:hypothetical protein
VVYTLGAVLSICSTMFLMGPWEQLKKMFHPSRLTATIVYLVSLVLTLYCAVGLHNAILTLLCLVVQLCAFVWYTLTYIPFGTRMLSMCCDSALDI